MANLQPANPRLTPDFQAAELTQVLDLTRLDDSLFQGHSYPGVPIRIFGGEVLGQALTAAAATVQADRVVHSAYAYFVLPGDSSLPVTYRVTRVRDGGSFATRQVEAIQHDRVIFTAQASFQRTDSPGSYHHQSLDMDAPDPDDLPHPRDAFANSPRALAWYAWLVQAMPLDVRFADTPSQVIGALGETGGARQRVWMRARGPLPEGPAGHHAVLAYLSDLFLLSAAAGPHNAPFGQPELQVATLDHGIWYHAPLDPGEWFLYQTEGYWTGQDRAVCRGLVFNREGALCASTIQEGLMRPTRALP